MLLAVVLIASCYYMNNDEDFGLGNETLEARIKSQFNYNQYWAGIPVSNRHCLFKVPTCKTEIFCPTVFR